MESGLARTPQAYERAPESVQARPHDFTLANSTLADIQEVSRRRGLAGAHDALPHVELVDNTPATPEREAQRLRSSVTREFSSPEMTARREQFFSDMTEFEARAQRSGLSPSEVSQTYSQIDRLLTAGPESRLPHDLRLALASQVMRNAALPTEIRQNTNTCNVTSLEVRTYTRQPSAAARLVADVATTGSFTGHDGTTVTLDAQSLTPSRAGTVNPEQESATRTFASQLFQVTAANIANARDPEWDGTRYGQIPVTDRSMGGESLTDASNHRLIGQDVGAAGLPNGLIRANESITGNTSDAQAFLVNEERYGRTASLATAFDSSEQLAERLEMLSRSGQLPASIFVHANSALFVGSSTEIPESLLDDGHYVSVTGYDPVTRTVRYDDQYGPESDRNTRPVPLQQFFDATHVVRANTWLDRLERGRDHLSQEQYASALTSIAGQYADQWSRHQSSNGRIARPEIEADRVSALARIHALAARLPAEYRERVESALMNPPAQNN